jgi:hypothetical protein
VYLHLGKAAIKPNTNEKGIPKRKIIREPRKMCNYVIYIIYIIHK